MRARVRRNRLVYRVARAVVAAPIIMRIDRFLTISQAGMSWVNRVVLPDAGRAVDDQILLVGGLQQLDDLLGRLDLPRVGDAAEVPPLEVGEVVQRPDGFLAQFRSGQGIGQGLDAAPVVHRPAAGPFLAVPLQRFGLGVGEPGLVGRVPIGVALGPIVPVPVDG